jgi:hypothetical protein
MMIFKEWIGIVLQLLTLTTIIVASVKVINRNIQEWDFKEARMTKMEEDIRSVLRDSSRLIAVEAKLTEISSEMSRVRDRLDRFLDTQSASRRGE